MLKVQIAALTAEKKTILKCITQLKISLVTLKIESNCFKNRVVSKFVLYNIKIKKAYNWTNPLAENEIAVTC